MTAREFVHRGFGGEAGPDDIAPFVVLVPTREEADALAGILDDVRPVADHYAWRVWTGLADGVRLTVCSTGTGSASAAIAIEELAVLGARTLLGLGTTRAPLEPAGTVLVAEGAMRLDAASQGYVRPGFPAVPDHELVLAAAGAAREAGGPVRGGIVADLDFATPADHGIPSPGTARAAEIDAAIREAAAVPVHGSPAVLLVQGTVHRLRTAFLAASGPGASTARLHGIGVAALVRLARWDGPAGGTPTRTADRVAELPPAG